MDDIPPDSGPISVLGHKPAYLLLFPKSTCHLKMLAFKYMCDLTKKEWFQSYFTEL